MTDRISVIQGDSREVLKSMADCSVDSGVMDPPYALVSIVKRFGKAAMGDNTKTSDRSRKGADGYARAARGFMGQTWDTGETTFDPEFWAEVLRVLKPGAHLVAFSGTRTYHRMACAIEDAGFEIRDQGAWCYGSGFPKSHNQHGEFEGWGTALKPAWEPICIARKPLEGTVAQNLAKWGVGALNIDGCRIPTGDKIAPRGSMDGGTDIHEGWSRPWMADQSKSDARLARAIEKAETLGRWPANIIHDGSQEVVALFPDSDGQNGALKGGEDSKAEIYGKFGPKLACEPRGDSGSAARFFYTAKADSDDRLGSKHPTVKPVDLMQWLVRLVTPKGGLVLDCFAGSGTTGEAAFREGMRAVLIEREEAYVADIHRRIELLMAGPDERKRSAIKEKIKDGRIKVDSGPLFGGEAA